MRRRVLGHDLYVCGHTNKTAARKAMADLVDPLLARGQPKGWGPLETTLAQGLQDFGLECLRFRKGAVQDANRMNRWLRAAGLPTLVVRPNENPERPGDLFAVKLDEMGTERNVPPGLGAHRQALAKQSDNSDRMRAYLSRMPAGEVQRFHVQDLVNALQSEGKKPATVRQEQALLRSFFNHARVGWNWASPGENPATHLKVKWKDNSRTRVMSKAEQARLDDAISECRNQLMAPSITLYTETAMRASEPIANARWSDVDWEAKVIKLRDSKTDKRDVPLSPSALKALRELQALTGGDLDAPVVSITYESLKAAWGRACERAGIDGLRIQDLRHTAATRMALKSGNVFLVKALTGHKTMAMVERYVNVKASDVVEFMHGTEPEPSASVPPRDSDPQPQAAGRVSGTPQRPEPVDSVVVRVDFRQRQRSA